MSTTQRKKHIAEVLNKSPLSPIVKELTLFAGIFVAVFIVSIAFVNANLLYHTVRDLFTGVKAENYVFTSDTINQAMQNGDQLKDLLQSTSSDKIMQDLKREHTLFVSPMQKTEASLQNKNYNFDYSFIPPGNRIFIPSIGVNAPIVDIDVADETKLKRGDFTNELFSGVVKYPSTPEPGTKGNALIFGHTSYYRWKKNPYGEIFAKIYSLHTGDEIKVARKGQLYTYEIVDSQVVTPNKVDSTYMQYTNGEYITLMGCYPIGTDSRRGLIFAKRKIVATPTLSLQN